MKIIKFLKKNSSTVVGVSVFILVIVAALLIKNLFMYDENQAIYGTRLDGIDKVKVSSEQKKKVETKLSESTKKVEVKVSGKIVNTTITTNDDTSLEDAKKLADSVLEEFTDAQKKFFDFQFFIKNDKNENQFPIIGYKQHARGNVSWTKDRAES